MKTKKGKKNRIADLTNQWKCIFIATGGRLVDEGTTRQRLEESCENRFFSKRQHSLKCKTASSLFPRRFSASIINRRKFSNYERKKKKKKKEKEIKSEKGNSIFNEISSLSGELRRYDAGVCFVAIIGLKNSTAPAVVWNVSRRNARGMVLLTQFPATRFSVNRTGARVRNNSRLKPGALLTSFQSVFQFLQIGPFNVSM